MFSIAVYFNDSPLSYDQSSSLEEEGARGIQRPATANSISHGAKSHTFDNKALETFSVVTSSLPTIQGIWDWNNALIPKRNVTQLNTSNY